MPISHDDDHPELPTKDLPGEVSRVPAGRTQVRFALSNLSAEWDDGRFDSLLDLSEELNIDISSGCRYGDCGTCLTQLVEGTVVYNHATGVEPDPGYCLPCSCRPLTSITLNA